MFKCAFLPFTTVVICVKIICKSDPFNRNLSYYTFNTWCDQDKALNLRDEATKILLNTKGNKNGMSKELKAFLEFIDTNSPTDEYTKCLADAVQTIKKDEGARDLYMTIEQQRLEDIAYTETRVREEMQQYIVAANNRADKAEQEAADAKQLAANAEQKAANAEHEAANAKRQNIANIIGICRNCDCPDEQIIKQLMERAHLTYDEACKALTEY